MNNNNEKEEKISINKILKLKDEENNIEPNKKYQYKCLLHSPLTANDCVNSIDIFNNYIAFGTVLGTVKFCRVQEKRSDLNISNININNINTNMSNKIKNKPDINVEKKEIILNIKDNMNKNNKNKVYKINPENDNNTRNDNGNIESIRIVKKNEDEHQSTGNYSSIDLVDEDKQKSPFFPKVMKLIQGCPENICCISLFNDILNFSIGDLELVHCEQISQFYGNDISMAHNFKRIEVYDNEQTHNDFCENCSCLMSTNNFLILYTYYSDFNWPLRINMVKYHNRNLNTNELKAGFIEMSNYNVPFDFNGNEFLYLEYFDESIRCINIYKTLNHKKKFKYLLDKKFGHISHMKLLPDNCIFLCRNLYECEIYKYTSDHNEDHYINLNIKENNNNLNNQYGFILLNKWIHNDKKEIISSNIYILESKISDTYKSYNNKESYQNYKIKKNNKKLYNYNYNTALHNIVNEMENSMSIDSSSSKNKILAYDKVFHYNKYNDIINLEKDLINNKIKENKKDKNNDRLYKKDSLKVNFNESDNNIFFNKDNYYIITLDIDGNFNLYYNIDSNKGVKNTLFNLYKIENISQKYKNINFFGAGFPYYITMNELFYVITTDSGVFVIGKNNEF